MKCKEGWCFSRIKQFLPVKFYGQNKCVWRKWLISICQYAFLFFKKFSENFIKKEIQYNGGNSKMGFNNWLTHSFLPDKRPIQTETTWFFSCNFRQMITKPPFKYETKSGLDNLVFANIGTTTDLQLEKLKIYAAKLYKQKVLSTSHTTCFNLKTSWLPTGKWLTKHCLPSSASKTNPVPHRLDRIGFDVHGWVAWWLHITCVDCFAYAVNQSGYATFDLCSICNIATHMYSHITNSTPQFKRYKEVIFREMFMAAGRWVVATGNNFNIAHPQKCRRLPGLKMSF